MPFVNMVAKGSNQIGKPGVDAVVDGKTPDGQDCDGSKAGRAGKPRKHDKIVTDPSESLMLRLRSPELSGANGPYPGTR